MSIIFLTLGDVLEIHQNQIKRYGGSNGIRDENLLISSIAQPYLLTRNSYIKLYMTKLRIIFFISLKITHLLIVIKELP